MILRYLPEVVTLELDPTRCDGCRMCLRVCPQGVFTFVDKRAEIADRDACMECGACALNCEAGALTVRSGVGCAEAILRGMLSGTEPTCDCGTADEKTSCC